MPHFLIVFFLCRLKPLDIQVMKALHHKVNIVPVIAKADTLTLNEVKSLKQKVFKRIKMLLSLSSICKHSFRVIRSPELLGEAWG